jgi:DNA-binding MarR family transcriptional regulator
MSAQDRYKKHQEVDRLTIDVDHEDTVLRTFILFVQTSRAVLKYADTGLYRKARLSIVKLIVLRTLASNNRAMTPSEIAEWTQTEPHNITTLIDRMRRDGLVTAERNSSDKRLVNITLTDKGREALNRTMPVAKEIVDRVMSSIDEGDAALLEKYLQTLRQNAHQGLEYLARGSRPQSG